MPQSLRQSRPKFHQNIFPDTKKNIFEHCKFRDFLDFGKLDFTCRFLEFLTPGKNFMELPVGLKILEKISGLRSKYCGDLNIFLDNRFFMSCRAEFTYIMQFTCHIKCQI